MGIALRTNRGRTKQGYNRVSKQRSSESYKKGRAAAHAALKKVTASKTQSVLRKRVNEVIRASAHADLLAGSGAASAAFRQGIRDVVAEKAGTRDPKKSVRTSAPKKAKPDGVARKKSAKKSAKKKSSKGGRKKTHMSFVKQYGVREGSKKWNAYKKQHGIA